METRQNIFYSLHQNRIAENGRSFHIIEKNEIKEKKKSGNSTLFFNHVLNILKSDSLVSEMTDLVAIGEAVNHIKGRLSNRRIYRIFSYIPFTKAFAIRKLIGECEQKISSLKINNDHFLAKVQQNRSNPHSFFMCNKDVWKHVLNARHTTISKQDFIVSCQKVLCLNFETNTDGHITKILNITSESNIPHIKFIVKYNQLHNFIKIVSKDGHQLYSQHINNKDLINPDDYQPNTFKRRLADNLYDTQSTFDILKGYFFQKALGDQS